MRYSVSCLTTKLLRGPLFQWLIEHHSEEFTIVDDHKFQASILNKVGKHTVSFVHLEFDEEGEFSSAELESEGGSLCDLTLEARIEPLFGRDPTPKDLELLGRRLSHEDVVVLGVTSPCVPLPGELAAIRPGVSWVGVFMPATPHTTVPETVGGWDLGGVGR